MKKFFAIFLSVVLFIGVINLCGCKSEDKGANSSNTNKVETTNTNNAQTRKHYNVNVQGTSFDNMKYYGFMGIEVNKFYYYQESPNEGLYVSNFDGTGKIKLIDGLVHDINFVGDKFYYVKDEFVSKTKSDLKDLYTFNLYLYNSYTGKTEKLIENCGQIYVTDKYIYYLYDVDTIAYNYDEKHIPDNQSYLYRYNINDKKSELIVNEPVCDYLIINDKVLYTKSNQDYIDKIYSVAINTTEHEKSVFYDGKNLSENGIDYFTVDDKGHILIYDDEKVLSYDNVTDSIQILYDVSSNKTLDLDKVIIYDNYLYAFNNQKTIIRINLTNHNSEKLFTVDNYDGSLSYLYLFDNECCYFDGRNTPVFINP